MLETQHSPGATSLREIERARDRIHDLVQRTPLVRLNIDDSEREIYLKLENLQPTGSFKIRGASNAIALGGSELKTRGVYTCSAGNMAQALAWRAKQNGISCTAIVPESAPTTKLGAIERYGAGIVKVSWDEVWKVWTTHSYPPLAGSMFVHPFSDARMIAANGSIGLEILEDLPDLDSVIVPFGGGGLTSGVATAIREKKPSAKIFTVEPETAAPFVASLRASKAIEVDRTPSFVDGIGGKKVFPEMFQILKPLVHAALVCSVKEIADAVRLLIERNRIVAEGAGAAPVAAAISGKAGRGKIVCIVSGGNIDITALGRILSGQVP